MGSVLGSAGGAAEDELGVAMLPAADTFRFRSFGGVSGRGRGGAEGEVRGGSVAAAVAAAAAAAGIGDVVEGSVEVSGTGLVIAGFGSDCSSDMVLSMEEAGGRGRLNLKKGSPLARAHNNQLSIIRSTSDA